MSLAFYLRLPKRYARKTQAAKAEKQSRLSDPQPNYQRFQTDRATPGQRKSQIVGRVNCPSMFRKKERLTSSDFSRIWKEASFSRSSRRFVLKCRHNSLGLSRFGVVVTSKFSKSAVKRNRKRRQIYACLREIQTRSPLPSMDCIVFLKNTPLPPAAYTELCTDLTFLFSS